VQAIQEIQYVAIKIQIMQHVVKMGNLTFHLVVKQLLLEQAVRLIVQQILSLQNVIKVLTVQAIQEMQYVVKETLIMQHVLIVKLILVIFFAVQNLKTTQLVVKQAILVIQTVVQHTLVTQIVLLIALQCQTARNVSI